LKVNPEIEIRQKRRLKELREKRDAARVNELLGQLETAAHGKENLAPLMVVCVENHLTLGEICSVLRRLWGEYEPPAWI
jgi:methylmalonyl-CoA mutase N-terminal domain/subunit